MVATIWRASRAAWTLSNVVVPAMLTCASASTTSHHFFSAARPPAPSADNAWHLAKVTRMDRSLRALSGRYICFCSAAERKLPKKSDVSGATGSSPLLPKTEPTVHDAKMLALDEQRVLVAHGAQDDPIFEYSNRAGLALWETDWETFVNLPSRQSARHDAREERERLLEEVKSKGFSQKYNGVRNSMTGRLFRINDVTVWNVHEDGDPSKARVGQAGNEPTIWSSPASSLPAGASIGDVSARAPYPTWPGPTAVSQPVLYYWRSDPKAWRRPG